MKLGIRGHLTDVITCVKLLVDLFRDYGVLTPPKLPFPIDLLRRPYNSVALLCDTVMTDPYCVRIIKRPQSGRGLGHVTKFQNFGTPYNI